MSIWLGYPEIRSNVNTPGTRNRINELLDEAIKLDDKISDNERVAMEEVERVKKEFEQKHIVFSAQSLLDDSRARAKIEELVVALLELDKKITELNEKLRHVETGNFTRSYELSGLKREVTGIKSIRIDSVFGLSVEQDRHLVSQHIPGRSGVDSEVSATIFQDMGRKPIRLSFHGVLVPDEGLASLQAQEYSIIRKVELLKWFFNARVPLFFASRLINRANMPTKVLIEYLRFEENNKVPNRVEFDCRLVEYSEIEWPETKHQRGFTQVENMMKFQTLNEATRYRLRFVRNGKVRAEELAEALFKGEGVKQPWVYR